LDRRKLNEGSKKRKEYAKKKTKAESRPRRKREYKKEGYEIPQNETK